jgi:signal transduction histidine kinase
VRRKESREPTGIEWGGDQPSISSAAQRSEIQADRDKLEQVISNLIGNALKFTPRKGLVSVATRNDSDGNVVIEVSDTGIGISPAALERIFLPFEQGDSSIHPRFGGLGLGLSIAYTLVEAQGGTIKAESRGVGHGAKFTASFKVDGSASGAPKPPGHSSTQD